MPGHEVVVIRLPIFIELFGIPLSFEEFMALVLSIVLLAAILYILLHEYSSWRRRRLIRAVVKAGE